LAASQQAILLTFDRDFGHLMIMQFEPKPIGVIYCRFIPSTPEETGELLLKVLKDNEEFAFEGYFTTLEKERLRSRKM
jgi:predicted nuclease of predicted toxin-antitoxin system